MIDDVINHLLLARPITVVSLVPMPLVDPEIPRYRHWLVIYKPVCRIHASHYMTMKPVVTFFFCQNTLPDKVT